MDLGTKTLGLAISDKTGLISSPYKLIRFKDINEAILEVKEIINKEEVDTLILGLPKNMNNTLGFAADRSLKFKELLEKEIDKEVILIDERLSTVEAENFLISSSISRKKRKDVIDALAASIILDTYLRKVNSSGKE